MTHVEGKTYTGGAIIFSILVVTVLMFSGLYFDVRITLISLPFLVFLTVLLMGWSKNPALNRGEMRRAITAVFVSAFIVLVLGNGYISMPAELKSYFLGVLSTIIGFYFGYRGRENELDRMERLVRGTGPAEQEKGEKE